MNYNLLRKQRRKLGFTQMQIANTLGVSEITVKSWECGKIGAKSSIKVKGLVIWQSGA